MWSKGWGKRGHDMRRPYQRCTSVVHVLLQVSRETSPAESGVVTVGIMTTGAGGAPNIIPNSVNIQAGAGHSLLGQHGQFQAARMAPWDS
jgi:metal-dependent amidase/aminoacylase/carboxypeptidase family protein